MLAEPAVDHRQLVLDAGFSLAVLDEVLVEQHERDDFGDAAGHDGKHQPDDGLTEITDHLPQYGHVTRGPLEGRRQFLLKALSSGLLPRHGGRGVEYELSLIYGRLGQQLPAPDQGRVKGPDNYVGRIVAAIFSLGIYMFWWFTTRCRSRTSTSPATGPRRKSW